MKKFLIIIGMLMLLTIPLTIVSAGELAAVPSQGIGDPITECQTETGITFDNGIKFEGNALSEDNTIAPVTIFNLGFDSANEVISLDWRSGTTGISVVIAKRGSSSTVFDYIGNEKTSGSVPPDTNAISHVTFCWNDPVEPTPTDPTPEPTPTDPTPEPTPTDPTPEPTPTDPTPEPTPTDPTPEPTPTDPTPEPTPTDPTPEPPKEQAEVELAFGACKWNENKSESFTEVTYTITGASLTFTNVSDQTSYGPFTESDVIALPAGDYTYSWTAVGDFTGSGEGEFTLASCEPGVASASVVLGACGFVDGTSLTPVTITVNNASLTLNGVTYTEGTTIELEPGEYEYTWEANEEGYTGEGSGILIVDSCEPKEEEEKEENPVDPQPDVAAGGSGPSFLYIMAPATIGITSLGLAWTAIKKKWMTR